MRLHRGLSSSCGRSCRKASWPVGSRSRCCRRIRSRRCGRWCSARCQVWWSGDGDRGFGRGWGRRALLMKKAMLAAVACAFLALGIWAVWPAANAAGCAFPTADKVAAAHALVSDPAPLGNATEAASVPERRGVVPDAPATGTLRLVLSQRWQPATGCGRAGAGSRGKRLAPSS